MSDCLSRRLLHSPWGPAIAVVLLLTAVDTALTVAGALHPLNEAATLQVYRFERPWLDLPMVALTYLGLGQSLAVIAATIALVAFVNGRRLDVVLLLAVFAAAAATQEVVKEAVHQPRPYFIVPPPPLSPLYDYGYVSGHATMSMAVLGFGAVVLCGLVESRWARWLVVTIALLLIAGIGFSRVYVGVHWVNDVVGGYLYGALIVLAASLVRSCAPRA